jgi:hypothetical protein
MSTGRSGTAEYPRVGKRALAAVLLAVALLAAAAMARTGHSRSAGAVRAGNSWGLHAPVETDGLSWG